MKKTHTDPISLVSTAALLVGAGDFLGAARLCDPVSLRAFKRNVVDQFAAALTVPRPMRAEDFTRHNPEMPASVAEYNAAQANRHMAEARDISREMPLLSSNADLMAADPDLVFAAHLDGRSMRRQLERQVALGLFPAAVIDDVVANSAAAHGLTAVGFVELGNGVGIVVCTRRPQHATPTHVPTPREEQYAAEHAARLEGLPPDERALIAQLGEHVHPQCCLVRQQDDGGWMLLADYQFLPSSDIGAIWATGVDDVPEAGEED